MAVKIIRHPTVVDSREVKARIDHEVISGGQGYTFTFGAEKAWEDVLLAPPARSRQHRGEEERPGWRQQRGHAADA